MNTVKSWPKQERPRERLFTQGAESLSDAELLAIILRNGLRGQDVVSLARNILSQSKGLRGLFALTQGQLKLVKGLGSAKIAILLAMTEIFKRQLKEELIGKNIVRDPQAVMDYLYISLRDKKKEVFKVFFLNKANCVMDIRDLFEGTVDESVVHPREVVKEALEHHATALILVHNHPSGRIQPSQEDLLITRKLSEACATVSIKILDHIIVGDNQYFSFREQGMLG